MMNINVVESVKLDQREISTVVAVLTALMEFPYEELNTLVGSETIDRMLELYNKMVIEPDPEDYDD